MASFKVVMMMPLLSMLLMTLQWSSVSGHGYLWTPPSRSSTWRKGYSTPHNYNDNALYCGGLSHQESLGYKCGICGDPYDGVRENEAGGKYAKGIITANYKQGDEITIQVQITANHKGWFEFKMCPNNDIHKAATQDCLDRYVLQLTDGSGTKTYVAKYGASMVDIHVTLPKDLTCSQCVLQWHYHSGNSWGTDKDTGKSCVGCGYQEEFFGCADVAIKAKNSNPEVPPTTSWPNASPASTVAPATPPTTTPAPETPPASTAAPTTPPTTPPTTTPAPETPPASTAAPTTPPTTSPSKTPVPETPPTTTSVPETTPPINSDTGVKDVKQTHDKIRENQH